MKIRGSVVSLSFFFPHPPEDEKKKNRHKKRGGILFLRHAKVGSCSSRLYPRTKPVAFIRPGIASFGGYLL